MLIKHPDATKSTYGTRADFTCIWAASEYLGQTGRVPCFQSALGKLEFEAAAIGEPIVEKLHQGQEPCPLTLVTHFLVCHYCRIRGQDSSDHALESLLITSDSLSILEGAFLLPYRSR